MESIITKISIDLQSPAVYEVVKAQQNDTNSRIIEVMLTNNGDKYPLNEVSTIKFGGHRSDSSSFMQDCTYTDDLITIVLKEDILGLHGLHEGRITLYGSTNNQILSTPAIKISVQKDPCFDKDNITEIPRNKIDETILEIGSYEEKLNQHIADVDIHPTKEEMESAIKKEVEQNINDLQEKIDNLEEEIGKVDATPENVVLYANDGEVVDVPTIDDNGISKWLKDKQGNILIPNTLTKTVYDEDGKNLDELLSSKSSGSLSNTVAGNNPVLTDSANAPLITFKAEGATIKNDVSINGVGSDGLLISTSQSSKIVLTEESVKNKTFTTEGDASLYVFASPWYGGFNRESYRAFDGDDTTFWCCKITDNMNGEYIGYNFQECFKPKSIEIKYATNNDSNPSYIIQGCKDTELSDNNVWDNLTDEIFKTNTSGTDTCPLNTDEKYAMFRLLFTGGKQDGSRGTNIYNITINCTIEKEVEVAPEDESCNAKIPLSSPLYNGDYILYNIDGSGELVRNNGVINSYNGEEITTDYISTTGELTNGAMVVYKLQEPTIISLTEEQITEFKKLYSFDGTTKIFCDATCKISYLMNNDGGMAIASIINKSDYSNDMLEQTITEVGKIKQNQLKISEIINQASNTWIISDYMKESIHYNCGIGLPEENGYSADDYNDENGWNEPYLDVLTGIVYYGTRIEDLPLTYGWVEKEQLASVQDKLEEVFQSVGNGKGLIASAITDKGVITDAEATFEEMAQNIGKIAGGGATLNDVLVLKLWGDNKLTLVSKIELSVDIDLTKINSSAPCTSIQYIDKNRFDLYGDFTNVTSIIINTLSGFFYDENISSTNNIDINSNPLEFMTAGEKICSIQGRDFFKTYDGLAIGGYIYSEWRSEYHHDLNATAPILISETEEGCAYHYSNGVTTAISSFVYDKDGKTYYVAGNGAIQAGDITSSSGRGLKINEIQEIRDAVNNGRDFLFAILDYYYGYI